MSGAEFETLMCNLFNANDFWALNIPRASGGQQPFDIIAIRRDTVYAVDCKVCSAGSRFPLSRIEDNQWLAFERVYWRTNAKVGLMVYCGGLIYFLSYRMLRKSADSGEKSVQLTSNLEFCDASKRDGGGF